MESFKGEYTVRNKVIKFDGFDKIESKEDAYFIGYMSADGNYIFGKKGNNNYPRMGLTSTNINVVEEFKERYAPNSTINYRDVRDKSKVNQNPTAEIYFPRGLTSTFKKFGIFDYKPKRLMIGIPKRYYQAYILGIIDADGWFSVRHRKDCRTPRLNIGIASSNLAILEQIQFILETDLNIASKIHIRKEREDIQLRIDNTTKAIEFCRWLYQDTPEIFNQRKKDIFDNYIKC